MANDQGMGCQLLLASIFVPLWSLQDNETNGSLHSTIFRTGSVAIVDTVRCSLKQMDAAATFFISDASYIKLPEVTFGDCN
jgi:hypothetical protein